MNDFGRASPAEWIISTAVSEARRERLLDSPSFLEITEDLIGKLVIHKIKKERYKKEKAYRAVAFATADTESVDRFFNAATGYRAQYFLDPMLGNQANNYVLRKLLPKFEVAMGRGIGAHLEATFLKASLMHDFAKIWIHQGLWLRWAKPEDRSLLVPLWQSGSQSGCARYQKLISWGSLLPETESRIAIKGGYICQEGRYSPLGKPAFIRADELHRFGFT